MAELNETPRGNRIHIAFFGLRNAGKSTLVNAFTGQPIAIVSDVAGTTTDPVSKAMEILPLGPCLVTDTAGLDDEGELGAMRVEKSLKVLETTDIAVWVSGEELANWRIDESRIITHRESRATNHEPRIGELANHESSPTTNHEPRTTSHELANGGAREKFLAACRRRNVTVLEYRRGESVEALKKQIAAVKFGEAMPDLLDGLVQAGDRVLCVVPIDESAPKGRLILPQQQVIRECLDRHLMCLVCQPEELAESLANWRMDELANHESSPTTNHEPRTTNHETLVVTDSQAFKTVSQTVERFRQSNGRNVRLTSFSILFARQKGDIAAYVEGLKALATLKDGDTVLIAEGCTHHRQCNDIGSVKIPKALAKMTGKSLMFEFASGTAFPSAAQTPDRSPAQRPLKDFALIVQCGGCMLTRREVLRRIGVAREAGVPIVNYGMVLAAANGLKVEDVLV